jgi:copper(I)-binding protein
MFMQLTQQLAEGSTVPLTLMFETAGTVEVQLMVGAINADEPACEHTEH